MFILVFIINLVSLFFLICALNVIRARYKLTKTSLMESFIYKSGFALFNVISLLLCLYYWSNPGWLIWINLTSINALIMALCLGFYPQFYTKWIQLFHFNQAPK